MSIFGDDGVDDFLNANLYNDGNQLPDDADENIEIFREVEQRDGVNQQVETIEPVKIQPKKRNILNPRPRLNVEVLRGQRGLHTIEEYFKDIKFNGKGKEKEDLDEVIRRLQHWGHRMYPTYKFDDVLTNIDRLGKKKPLQVHMSRYRLGLLDSLKNHEEIHDDDDNDARERVIDEPYDEFDALLDEQIAISKTDPRTPGASSSRHSTVCSSFTTPSFTKGNVVISTPYTGLGNFEDVSDLATPLPPSQPSTPAQKQQLTAEQLGRIAENRRIAQERLAAKKRLQEESSKESEVIDTVY